MDRHIQHTLEAQLYLLEQEIEKSLSGSLSNDDMKALTHKVDFFIEGIELTLELIEHKTDYLCHDLFVNDMKIYLNMMIKNIHTLSERSLGDSLINVDSMFYETNVVEVSRLRALEKLLYDEKGSKDVNKRYNTVIDTEISEVQERLYKRLGISFVISQPPEGDVWKRTLEMNAATNSSENAA